MNPRWQLFGDCAPTARVRSYASFMTMQKSSHPAGRSARTYQAVMDAFMAAIVLLTALTFFGWLLPLLPGLDDGIPFGYGLCSGSQPCDYTWIESVDGSGGSTFWVSLLLASLTFLAVSGAFSKSRRSPGMVAASSYPVSAKSVGTADRTPPGSLRMMGRWTIVLALFAAGTYLAGNGLGGILLVAGAWVPSLFGSKRALHDVVTGTAVVELALQDKPTTASTTLG